MKETKIAKENLKNPNGMHYNDDCYSHRDTCQRWLDFLINTFGEDLDIEEEFDTIICNKIKDLKQAIKLYKDIN